MNIASRIIPTSFVRWMENLPEWALLAGMIGFILFVILIMWLVIRKLNSQTETKSSTYTPNYSSKPPVVPPSKPAPVSPLKPPLQPVSAPAAKPQPVPPMQSVSAPVSETPLKPLTQSAPVSVPKPQPATTPQPAAVPVKPPLEIPSTPLSESLSALDPSIYNKIASLGGTNRTILFAGAGLEHLPVTVPVQIAANLAGGGKKVLLIDLDMKRNAVAKVFDPNETVVKSCTRPKPLVSPVENLSFWPAEFFVRFGQMNLRTVIQSASPHFEVILINAPYLDGHPDRKLIASSAKYGLVFCKTKQQSDRLQALLKMGECQLLESKPIVC